MDVGRVLRELAERQHGVIALHQTRIVGSRHAVAHHLTDGGWEQVHPGVHRVLGSVQSVDQRTMAGLLRAGPGAVLSHQTALALWGVAGFDALPVHVLRLRGSNGVKVSAEGLHVHETRRLPPHHVTVLGASVLTTPSRTLADLARRTRPARLERFLDGLWVRGLVTHDSLDTVIGDLASRGRPGIRVLRALVAARGRDFVPPASGLESRLNRVLSAARLPSVSRQVDVGGEQWVGRADFRVDGTTVLVEAQSERYHTAISAVADDERRRRALEAAGFTVVEAWDSEIWHRPQLVVARVRAAIARTASVRAGGGRL